MPTRKEYLARLSELEQERQPLEPTWRLLSENFQPRRASFFDEVNGNPQASKKASSLINNTPLLAVRTLASGMMAGITSPARQWFMLTTPDPAMAELAGPKQWLKDVADRILEAFARSNVYNALHETYTQLPTFGTGAMHVDFDAATLLRAYVYPVGRYYLCNNAELRVDACYRKTRIRAKDLAKRFGEEKCSNNTRNLLQQKKGDTWVDVLHVVEPNKERSAGAIGHTGMAYRSAWLEINASDTDALLGTGGYEEFPVMAPRWVVAGEEVWGHGPALEALGDARELQLLEKRQGTLIDKLTDPPMAGPSNLTDVSLVPGAVNLFDAAGPAQRLAPIQDVPPGALQWTGGRTRTLEQRINAALYADLWLSMLGPQGPQMTAREVAERHEEKMLQLGPVLEALHSELLSPLINRTFGLLLRHGLIPPPPEELQGMELKVEYVSIMAQAQRLLGSTAVERLTGYVLGLAQVNPEVLDKVNFDQAVDEYGNMLGVPPSLVRTDDEVAAMRAQRAQAQAAAQAQAEATQAVQNISALGKTPVQEDNALGKMLGALGPVAGATAGGAE